MRLPEGSGAGGLGMLATADLRVACSHPCSSCLPHATLLILGLMAEYWICYISAEIFGPAFPGFTPPESM